MNNKRKAVFDFLDQIHIHYRVYEHDAVFTVAESETLTTLLPGGHAKNLFVYTKKAGRYYLIIIQAHKRADLKALERELAEGEVKFASADDLERLLGVTPGSVSPFGLINDANNQVKVIVDQDLLSHELVCFHPNENTASLAITSADFKKYLAATQHDYQPRVFN